ncbi:MAG: hypothetical protein AAFW83_11885 [Pseudomonadota bacterium]
MSNADENREGQGDNETPPLRQVCLDDLEEALDRIMDEAAAGVSTIIIRDGVPIARFVPVEGKKS